MKTITISMQILTGNLFRENGYDEMASAENYAALVESAFRTQAARDWPDATIVIDIDIQRASGSTRGLEIEGQDNDGDPMLCDEHLPFYDHVAELIFGGRFDEWAVAKAEA